MTQYLCLHDATEEDLNEEELENVFEAEQMSTSSEDSPATDDEREGATPTPTKEKKKSKRTEKSKKKKKKPEERQDEG